MKKKSKKFNIMMKKYSNLQHNKNEEEKPESVIENKRTKIPNIK